MLVSLDIETACNVPECKGYGDSRKCDHALQPRRSQITVAAVYWEVKGEGFSKVFRNLDDLRRFISEHPTASYFGHNFKFDIKHLRSHGVNIPLEQWSDCTQCMALAYTHKIDQAWLEGYEARRKIVNKRLGASVHRDAGMYSLKTLAPYFAGVPEFWESEHHDNDEYVTKDVTYTYKLYQALLTGLKQDGTYAFYRNKLIPWVKFLLEVEIRGVKIDIEAMEEMEKTIKAEIIQLKQELDKVWEPAYREYFRLDRKQLYKEFLDKYLPQITMAPTAKKADQIKSRALKSLRNRIQKLPKIMNLDSPSQLNWLFKEYLKLDIRNPEGDETTGKEVLEKLIFEGRDDVRLFSEYKKKTKLLTSFFASYKEMLVDGQLFCNFNISGTRTGRLSSSGPNLQQVPGSLHHIFRARPGKLLATYDMSAIEPRLIAYFSECPTLCHIMISGEDFHGDAAKSLIEYVACPSKDVKRLFKKERDLAKQVDLSLFYGSGVNRLMHTAHKHGFNWSLKDCQHKLHMFKRRFEQVFRFKNDELDPMLVDGSVTNVLGRTFRIDDSTEIYMKGFNTLIQSSGSDLVLNSGHLIDKEFKERGIDGGVLMLVHDELVIEIPEDRKEECVSIIIDKMTNYKLETIHGRVKLEVEGKVAKTWEK